MLNGLSERAQTDDNDAAITLNDVILAKGDNLFSLLEARYGTAEFNQFLNYFIKDNEHKTISFNWFDNQMTEMFKDTISKEINNWYLQKSLPGFLVKDVQTYKVLEGEFTKYQLRFKIANPENCDGLITINIDLDNQQLSEDNNQVTVDFAKEIYIPANSAREIGFVFATEPNRMNIYTHISENLPNNIIYDFDSFDEIKKMPGFDDVRTCEMFTSLEEPNEFIVDNEDDGFEYIQNSNKSYLKSLIDKNKPSSENDYVGIRYWDPPDEWRPILRSGFYGKYVRSARYTSNTGGDRMAIWHANLSESSFYDVYFHIDKISMGRRYRKSDYNFRVYHEDGIEEINLADEELENGWNYLGSFFISPESARVELSNKSVGQLIIADAIKWVKND